MSPFAAARRAERVTTSVSLVVGPLVMSIGDLLHPEERMSPVEQIAIVVDRASRWYTTAHLLLFFGMLLFIPGFLGLTALTAVRKPVLGYARRACAPRVFCRHNDGRYSAVARFRTTTTSGRIDRDRGALCAGGNSYCAGGVSPHREYRRVVWKR
jgi:hypothetical protein